MLGAISGTPLATTTATTLHGKTFELLDDGRLIEYAAEYFERTLTLHDRPSKRLVPSPPKSNKSRPRSPSLTTDKDSNRLHPFFTRNLGPTKKSLTETTIKRTKALKPRPRSLRAMPKAPSTPPNRSSTPSDLTISRQSSRSSSLGPVPAFVSRSSSRGEEETNHTDVTTADTVSVATSTADSKPKTRRQRRKKTPPPELLPYSYLDPDFATAGTPDKRVAPKLFLPQDSEETDLLLGSLTSPLGFDMEWRPQYKKGQKEYKTALIQVSDCNFILLIHVCKMTEFPSGLKRLIESKDTVKLGVNIRGDFKKLRRDFGIEAGGAVELDSLARQVDTENDELKRTAKGRLTLQRAVNIYCGKGLDKGRVRVSNWEETLGEAQKTYAANDAHCALSVYHRLCAMAKTLGTEIDLASITDEPSESDTMRAKNLTNAQPQEPTPAENPEGGWTDRIPTESMLGASEGD